MTTFQDDWHTRRVDELCAAVLTLETTDELAAFLRDLCTHHEISELSARWAVARYLHAGRPYREIARLTGSSTATVTRVNQWLKHGTGGYQLALERIQKGNAEE